VREGVVLVNSKPLRHAQQACLSSHSSCSRSCKCLCPCWPELDWSGRVWHSTAWVTLTARLFTQDRLCVSLPPLPQDTAKQCESSRRGCQRQPGGHQAHAQG
jgi:hypothetical protein